MIPTVIVVGLLVGRWWIVPLGGLGWALLVVALGPAWASLFPEAFVLGAANAALGAAARVVAVRTYQAGRRAADDYLNPMR